MAGAHLGNISYADFDVRGSEVLLQFRYAAHVTPGVPQNQTTPPTRAQLMALHSGIEEWLTNTAKLDAGGGPCPLTVENIVGPDSNVDITLLVLWTCDAPIEGLRMDFRPLAQTMPDWQTIASIKIGGKSLSTVFTPGSTRWTVGEVRAAASAESADGPAGAAEADEAAEGSAFTRFFLLGVEHIWTGYDHLLFLLAVLLAGGGIRRLAAIVTSFTIAHSITLGAAAMGLVHLPVAPVEAAIALSIVYVAAENLFELGGDRRAFVTFGFGLIHGFGFASVLSQAALPASGIVVPLLAFNLGVEAGQLAVVLVVVPLLAVAMRSAHARRIKMVLSGLIALAGAVWAVERIGAILSG